MHIYYYLTLTPSGPARGDVLLNGFPLTRDPIPPQSTWMDMVNLHLTGADNSLQVRLKLEGGGGLVRLQLRRFPEGSIVTPEDGEPVRLAGAVQASDGTVVLDGAPDGIVTGDLRFGVPEFDFSEVYRAPGRVDEPAAAALAQSVAEALASGDVAPLMEASRDRIADLALAFGLPVNEAAAAVEAEYADMAAIGLRPPRIARTLGFAGGRLVEPVAIGDAPLLRTREDHPDPTEARLFLGMRRGRLQIVR